MWTGPFLFRDAGRSYGRFKQQLVHRVAWELARGAIPKGMEVMHKCDQPKCFNPDHLQLGTHAQNMKDAASKGRFGVPASTRQKVLREVEAGAPVRLAAARHGVSWRVVYAWLHKAGIQRRDHRRHRSSTRQQARAFLEQGLSCSQVARRTGVPYRTVYMWSKASSL